jgi:hypothetical protein
MNKTCPRCGRIQPCPDHKDRGSRGGSTRAWRKTRERVLKRDAYRCRIQLDGCTGTATHVDTSSRELTAEATAHQTSSPPARAATSARGRGDPRAHANAHRPTLVARRAGGNSITGRGARLDARPYIHS